MTSLPSPAGTVKDPMPALGSMPWWQKIKLRVQIRMAYGRWGANGVWGAAVRRNNVALADRLLAASILPPADEPGHTAWSARSNLLFESVGFLDGRMVHRLLAMGANPNHIHQNNYWDAPTHRAARYGNIQALEAMLAHGGDPNLRDGNKYTPGLAALDDFGMAYRTESGKPAATVEVRWRMAEACVAAGADVHAQASHGQDLLSYALTDTPDRVEWALGLGLTLADPRAALEDVLFSDLRYVGDSSRFVRSDGLARARHEEDSDFHWDRWAMADILVREGAMFTGSNAAGRTLLEEGIAREALTTSDVAELVRRGAPLDVVDGEGNTLTHQLLCKRAYANTAGTELYDALRAAGLPDQTLVRNRAGQTPMEALESRITNWTVGEAMVFDQHLSTPKDAAFVPESEPKVERAARFRLSKRPA